MKLVKLAVIFFVFALLLAPAAALYSEPLFPHGHSGDTDKDKDKNKDTDADKPVDISKLTPYKKVGVIEFEEASEVETGAERFYDILLGRLKNARPETEFVKIEVKLDSETPLMGDTARKLGTDNGLDAILTGAFAVKVVGGSYPTQTNNTPVGNFVATARVIDCTSGWSRGDVAIKWDHNKIYPESVSTQKDLEGKIMRDGVNGLIKALTNKGLLFFEPAKEADDSSGGDADSPGDTGSSGDDSGSGGGESGSGG